MIEYRIFNMSAQRKGNSKLFTMSLCALVASVPRTSTRDCETFDYFFNISLKIFLTKKIKRERMKILQVTFGHISTLESTLIKTTLRA